MAALTSLYLYVETKTFLYVLASCLHQNKNITYTFNPKT